MKRTKKAPPAPAVNEALRQWTRGVSFTLAMGKTQVAVLVAADLSRGRPYPPVGADHKLVRQFVTAMHGLEARGLITAHCWIALRAGDIPRHRQFEGKPFDEKWEITDAGAHVIGLLKLSGIYDELRLEFEASDAAKRRPRIA